MLPPQQHFWPATINAVLGRPCFHIIAGADFAGNGTGKEFQRWKSHRTHLQNLLHFRTTIEWKRKQPPDERTALRPSDTLTTPISSRPASAVA